MMHRELSKNMNKSLPKVSIVILDYLKSKRVCENVESIQKQVTDFNFEIIIVDNSKCRKTQDSAEI
jgi:glycosyltransferase involved in cell wall biosynthesis